ncbi:restriction endonuclease [Streptomyces sp. PT12]|uniref:restriction endonuclease n=1 Tax=Streptomyces sp. PT12 TaxID=1510197 RepID=UPI000DE34250|nr:restriction endonuclease [Streptomyces sp. PT12]RBM05548.1 restriction endonuclease [Streptomyces sp. PT12]
MTPNHEADLLESRVLRDHYGDRVDVLDKVKALRLLPDDLHVTTAMVAEYYEVGIKAITSLVVDHRQEMEACGYLVLTGAPLNSFKDLSGISSRTGSLALFTRRAVLNVGMLLRDSVVARQVRTYLLDTEEATRAEAVDQPVDNSRDPLNAPVDNFVRGFAEWVTDRIVSEVDRRTARFSDAHTIALARDAVREVIGRAVLPLLNASHETTGELLRRVTVVEDEQVRLWRVLKALRA